MHMVRVLARSLASNAFRLCLLLFAIGTTLWLVFGSAASVKQLLDRSGAFNQLPDIIVSQIKQQQQANPGVAAAAPEITAAAKAAFSASFLRTSADQVIDGTYHWLDGTTKQPDFSVDLRPAIAAFEQQAADSGVQRINALPVCSIQQLRQLDPAHVDLFSVACRPANLSADSLRQQFVATLDKQLAGNGDRSDNANVNIIQKGKITVNDLPKDEQGRGVFDHLSAAPRAYRWLKLTPWLALGAFGLLAVAVVFLFDDRRRGVRSVGISLIGIGILLTVIGAAGDILFNRTVHAQGLHFSDTDPQRVVVAVAQAFSQAIDRDVRWFGISFLVAGAVMLVVLKFVKPKTGTELPTANKPEARPAADGPDDTLGATKITPRSAPAEPTMHTEK